jgi:hypothetical protein
MNILNADFLTLQHVKTQKKALIDAHTLRPILPFEYDDLKKCVFYRLNATQLKGTQADTFLIATKEKRSGIFEPRTQKWLLPLEYSFLQLYMEDSLFITLKNGLWAIRNIKGQIIENQSFTHFGKNRDNYFGQRGDSVLFFKQDAFPIPIPIQEACGDYRKLIQLETFDDKSLIVNQLQKVVVPPNLQIVSLENDYAVVRDTVRHLQFLTDHKGKSMVFLPKFGILQINIDENVMIVFDSTTQKLGAIRQDGHFILKPDYFALFPLDSAGVIWAKKEASPPLSGTQWEYYKYEKLDYERDTVHYADKGWAMYDKTGRLLTNTLFEYAFEWYDSVGIGLVNGKFGLWHASGKNLVPPNYNKIWHDDFNQMYHLFELQTNDNQLVGFANARGQIVADGLFKNMSSFNGQYAFVETAQGLGIVSKIGKYLVEPSAYNIQQNVLNLMPLVDSLSGYHRFISYVFRRPYDSIVSSALSDFQQKFNMLSVDNQRFINNLLIESLAPNYFLRRERITYDRARLDMYNLAETEEHHYVRVRSLNPELLISQLHITDMAMSQKYTNFSAYSFTSGSLHQVRNESIRKSINYKRVNNVWEKITLDNLLNINDKNNALFLKLFAQKLSALKNTNLDCSDPSKYIEMIKNNFYVLDEGIQFRLFPENGRRYFYEYPVSILCSWAELKPFLN